MPPVPVFIKRGCGADFLINICLSILGWIPGVLRKLPPLDISSYSVLMRRNRCILDRQQDRETRHLKPLLPMMG